MADSNKMFSAEDFDADFTLPTADNSMANEFAEEFETPVPQETPVEQPVQPMQQRQPVQQRKPVQQQVAQPKQRVQQEVQPELKKVTRTGSETEIREVDPTKNAKLQKRLKQKPKEVNVGKFHLPKKLIYIAIPVVAIILMLVVKAIKGGGSGSSAGGDGNYFSILDTIVQNEVGQFTYTIDVRTKEAEPVTETPTEDNYEDVANTEGGAEMQEGAETEEVTAEPEVVTKNKFTESWGTAEDIKVFSWQYPNYKVIIDGVCTNADPNAYEADIKISLATVGHNDLLTEIVAKDGKYYVDFDSLGVWLRSSKDAYLTSLGADIPEGAKYVEISKEDFSIPSRYAEDYEKSASAMVGLHDNIQILNATIAYLEGNLQECIGSECFSTSVAEGGKTEHINIGTETGKKIVEKVKAMVQNDALAYDGYLSYLQSKTNADGTPWLSEAQLQQRVNEKDNFLYAMTPLQVYFNTHSIDNVNLQAVGSARQYVSAGQDNIAEADLTVQFQSDTTFYNIQFTMTRKSGSATVELDTGNVIDINQLVSNEDIDSKVYLLDKFNRLIDYLNPTIIQLSKQMEMNPDRVSETIKQALVDIVNSIPEQTGVYLTTLTADKYIEIYKALIDKKDELTGTDKVNTLIVEDFLKTVNDITGGVIVEVPVEQEVEQITYPEMVYEDSDMKIIANFNQELSNKNVFVVSTTIMNKTENSVVLNLTNFSLRTLLSSTYSSNNLTTLRDVDNTWDESLTPQAIELPPSSYADIDLYFAVVGDSGYMDMWYQPVGGEPIKLGVIIQE